MVMPTVKLSLSVRDSHLGRLGEVAKAAEKAGMAVERQIGSLGIVTGSIDAEKLGQLGQIAGVENVETERGVQIPPPGSDVQ